jgi:hypothetical protein
MKKKNLFIGMAAALFALLFVVGCPLEPDDTGTLPAGDGLVSSISISGVAVNPLPVAGTTIENAAAGSVVINVERPPLETEADGIYYKSIQPITVTLANVNETVYFEVTAPDAYPEVIEIPGTPDTANAAQVTRNIGVTLPNGNSFPEGQTVWIRVVAADESKTNYYKIAVTSQTHDTAINAITVSGNDVLEMSHSAHIGPWLGGENWAAAAAALADLSASQASGVVIAATPRNNQFDLSKPKIEYAKIPVADAVNPAEPADWSTAAPTSFANHDILAVKVTASNGKTFGYLKITVNVGGSPFLESLKVNNKDIALGNPGADIATVGGTYRVEDGQDLTAVPVTWAVTPVKADANAAVTWALAAKGAAPQAGDFTSPTSFDTSHNYLYIKVVSHTGEFTMYYLVVFDERPRDTEHVKTGRKSVPVYRFTIPAGKTWADMGDYPKIRVKILQQEAEFNQSDGYQRHFVFGELARLDAYSPSITLNTDTLTTSTGGASFGPYMPLIVNKAAKAWAVDTAAPDMWFTAEWVLNDPPDDKQPWDSNTNFESTQGYDRDNLWPLANTTGDVYFGLGITHDSIREYWIKELSLVSQDGTLQIFCDLLGSGRVDSTSQNSGFVRVDAAQAGDTFLRELVADPTLN